MVDFHSHFLPGIDDGSDSVTTSLAMLNAWKSQGIDEVFATPHFYADRNTPERFLRKRAAAYDQVRAELSQVAPDSHGCWPKIRLGAEVRFFDGISRFEGLRDLCLEGTDLLLLEMPFCDWTSRMVDEVGIISSSTGLKPVAAHIERYLDQPHRLLKDFLNLNILFQSNAEFFLEPRTSRKAVKMLKKGQITFLGSDAHNMSRRPVNLGPALGVIKKSLGEGFVEALEAKQNEVLDYYRSDVF